MVVMAFVSVCWEKGNCRVCILERWSLALIDRRGRVQ